MKPKSFLKDTHPEIYSEIVSSDFPKELLGSACTRQVQFRCPKGHLYQSTPAHRAAGRGCPYCAHRAVLPNETSLGALFPSIAAEWDYEANGDLTPFDVLPRSAKRIHWVCSKGHKWVALPHNRVNKGQNCPYCSGRYAIEGESDISTVYPDIAAEFDTEKNSVDIKEVKPNSGKYLWWKCPNGHSYEARANDRVWGKRGCPYCSDSSGEQLVSMFLRKYGVDFLREVKFPDCADVEPLPFDFVLLREGEIVGEIEYNGFQHYEASPFWRGTTEEIVEKFRVQQKHDEMKAEYLRKEGIAQLIVDDGLSLAETERAVKEFLLMLGLM